MTIIRSSIIIIRVTFFVCALLSSFCASLSTTTKTCAGAIEHPKTKSDLRLLSRHIKKCKGSEEVLALISDLPPLSSDEPFVAAMRVFGKEKRPDLALHLYENICQSEACRTWAITICGKCGKKDEAIKLLTRGKQPPSVASYNSAIAACCRDKNNNNESYKDALRILHGMPCDKVENLTCNAVLTCLAKAKQGQESRKLLSQMVITQANDSGRVYPNPDLISYHRTLNALIWSKDVNSAFQVLQEMEKSPFATPITESYDMVANAMGKAGNWTFANLIERSRQEQILLKDNSGLVAPSQDHLIRQYYQFEHWDSHGLTKVGGDKYAYWEVGKYTSKHFNMTIAFQPHRNPSKNGIKLVFFDTSSSLSSRQDTEPTPQQPQANPKKKKIGYLLMINSPLTSSSTFLGMFLSPTERGGGRSKLCLAIWMHFCLQANIQPITGVMNKPLLSLVLQHKFGYTPRNKKQGVDVEITAGDAGAVVLYSSTTRSLSGAFSPHELLDQNIVLSSAPPQPRGRLVRVRAALDPPQDSEAFRQAVDDILNIKTTAARRLDGGFSYEILPEDLRRVFLGK